MTSDAPCWPSRGDSLLASTTTETEASVGNPSCDFDFYAYSYKRAGDALALRVEAAREGPETFVYPICFLYRHYVELMLKALASMDRELDGQPPAYPKTHRIDLL
ncbi:MAG TPA: hypothetical protein VGR97_06950 [Candidatus Acidoferrales bacterium]|nr:hypothetical protein [Candidatus Acidoferrales bacterium]